MPLPFLLYPGSIVRDSVYERYGAPLVAFTCFRPDISSFLPLLNRGRSCKIRVCADGIFRKGNTMKKTILYAAGAILLSCSGLMFLAFHYGKGETAYYVEKGEANQGQTEEEKASAVQNREVLLQNRETSVSGDGIKEYGVFVCGQVQKEGVYYLTEGSRVQDAIALAGGFTDEADTSYWNLAAFVTDGQKIYVPKPGETVPVSAEDPSYDSLGRLDLNRATAAQLIKLPGIGEKRAADIIKYREKIGRFESLEQLKEIPGIKESLLSGIRDSVCVR